MANRLFSPDEQYADATGTPYAGGTLSFYASGTGTPLATYANQGLTIPNTNPVVLDSAGRQGTIFLQNLAYKVVLADVNGNQIWTEDPVFSSDFSTVAQVLTYPGNPNGFVAGTAGSGTIPSSLIWDTLDQILWVATQTGTALTTVWTNVSASSAPTGGAQPPPQGYLTLSSGAPILTGDVTGATAIFYSPLVGNNVPIWNGSSFATTSFSQLTLNLSASQLASTLYDVFVFNNAGVITLGTGPSWQTSTNGSGARGVGAGTTQIVQVNGLWVNNVAITLLNGATSTPVSANQATYLGTISIDTVAGQVSCYRTIGQSRKFGVYNAYNQRPITLQVNDGTASWGYTTAAFRASNGNVANAFVITNGLADQTYLITFSQTTSAIAVASASTAIATPLIGIGVNATFPGPSPTGLRGQNTMSIVSVTTLQLTSVETNHAEVVVAPFIGNFNFTALESGTISAGSNCTFAGNPAGMLLQSTFMG